MRHSRISNFVARASKSSPREILLALEAVALLCVAWILVKMIGFSKYRSLVERRRTVGAPADHLLNTDESGSHSTRKAVALAVARAVRTLPWGIHCLPQAIAAKWMLNFRNIDSRLVLGVAREDGAVDFRAHAWLESNGEIVTGKKGIDGTSRLAEL